MSRAFAQNSHKNCHTVLCCANVPVGFSHSLAYIWPPWREWNQTNYRRQSLLNSCQHNQGRIGAILGSYPSSVSPLSIARKQHVNLYLIKLRKTNNYVYISAQTVSVPQSTNPFIWPMLLLVPEIWALFNIKPPAYVLCWGAPWLN